MIVRDPGEIMGVKMSKFTISMVALILGTVLCCVPVCASGSGSHSHGHQEAGAGEDNAVIVHKDSKDGIDAYLEFCDFDGGSNSQSKGFIVKCNVRAFLKNAETGQYLTPSKLVLRATIGHDQFGEAMALLPVEENRMQTDLFVKKKGEQHYLLTAEIEGVGVKEFHFHHTF
jgi:hypothetical protein